MNEVFQHRLAPRKRLLLLRRISPGRWIASGLQRATDNPVRGDPPVAGSAFCGDPVKRGTTCRKFCKGCSAGSRDKPEKSIRRMGVLRLDAPIPGKSDDSTPSGH